MHELILSDTELKIITDLLKASGRKVLQRYGNFVSYPILLCRA